MKNLQDWLKELISDERWHEQAGKNHKPETFQKVAEQVYTLGISDRDNFEIVPLREHRNHVVNKLNKILPDKPKVDWISKALEKQKVEEKAKEAPPVSWEKRAEYLQQIQEILKESKMMSSVPRVGLKEAAEQGGWLPPKSAPYPTTSARELYVRQRHFAYIGHCYDARTAQRFPTWMEEEEFNKMYDEKEAAKLEKKVYKTLKA